MIVQMKSKESRHGPSLSPPYEGGNKEGVAFKGESYAAGEKLTPPLPINRDPWKREEREADTTFERDSGQTK